MTGHCFAGSFSPYTGMLRVAMPCLYETYYTMLLLPVVWLTGTEACKSPSRHSIAWIVVICPVGTFGACYQLIKPEI